MGRRTEDTILQALFIAIGLGMAYTLVRCAIVIVQLVLSWD